MKCSALSYQQDFTERRQVLSPQAVQRPSENLNGTLNSGYIATQKKKKM